MLREVLLKLHEFTTGCVCVLQLVQGKISQQQYLKDKDHQHKRLQQLTDEVETVAQQL